MMVEVIKARLNVSLYNPRNSCEVFLYLRECRVTASFRSKTVRIIAECRLIDCFKNHSDHFLHQLIISRSDSQRTEFPVLFGNVLSFCRLWLIRPVAYGFNNPVDSRQAHVVQCLPVHPLRHASLRFRNVRISKEIELWIV